MRFIVEYIPKKSEDCPFYNNGKCYGEYDCDNECFKNPSTQPPAECNGMIGMEALAGRLKDERDGDIYFQ